MHRLHLLKAFALCIAVTGVYSNICQPNDTVIYVRMNEVKLFADVSDEIISMNPPLPLTPTCRQSCDKAENCTGFSIDYQSNECVIYSRDIEMDKLQKDFGYSTFNKICLDKDAEIPTSCKRKGWQADMWPNWSLSNEGFQLENVSTIENCIGACLTNLTCGSVTFTNNACIIHEISSRRAPLKIVRQKGSTLVDNWCHKDSLSSCKFSAWSGLVPVNSDINIKLSTAKECEMECNNAELIPCWTYTYNETSQVCSLSADNNMLKPDETSDSVYGERECIRHGRRTREGVCTCDVTSGGSSDGSFFGRVVNLVRNVGNAFSNALSPGKQPEAACQCIQKPGMSEEESGTTEEAETTEPGEAAESEEPSHETAQPVEGNSGSASVGNVYPPNGGFMPPSNNFPSSLYGGMNNPNTGYDPYNPNSMQGFYNPYYTPQGRDRRGVFLPYFKRYKR